MGILISEDFALLHLTDRPIGYYLAVAAVYSLTVGQIAAASCVSSLVCTDSDGLVTGGRCRLAGAVTQTRSAELQKYVILYISDINPD